MFPDSPSPTVKTPAASVLPTMRATRFVTRVPTTAIASPPASMPAAQNTSLVVSFQTSSPKVRVTMSGVR